MAGIAVVVAGIDVVLGPRIVEHVALDPQILPAEAPEDIRIEERDFRVADRDAN